MSYPKHIYHHNLEKDVTKHIEHEDHHPEWYDYDLDPDYSFELFDEEFDYDDGDY